MGYDLEDLDIDLSPGRKAEPVEFGATEELSRADVAALASADRPAEVPTIKRLSDRHHQLAKLLAAGIPPGQAANMTNYEPARVSVLQATPAFQELVAHYKEVKVDPSFDAILSHMSGLTLDAIVELRERMEDPEKAAGISVGQLLEIIKVNADRTGRGPTSNVNHSHTHDMGDKIAAARERAKAKMLARRGEVEDAEIVPDE